MLSTSHFILILNSDSDNSRGTKTATKSWTTFMSSIKHSQKKISFFKLFWWSWTSLKTLEPYTILNIENFRNCWHFSSKKSPKYIQNHSKVISLKEKNLGNASCKNRHFCTATKSNQCGETKLPNLLYHKKRVNNNTVYYLLPAMWTQLSEKERRRRDCRIIYSFIFFVLITVINIITQLDQVACVFGCVVVV